MSALEMMLPINRFVKIAAILLNFWGRMHEKTKKTICVLVTTTLSLTQLHFHLENNVCFCICLSFVVAEAKKKAKDRKARITIALNFYLKNTHIPLAVIWPIGRIETSTVYTILCATSITNDIHWLRIYFQFVCCLDVDKILKGDLSTQTCCSFLFSLTSSIVCVFFLHFICSWKFKCFCFI